MKKNRGMAEWKIWTDIVNGCGGCGLVWFGGWKSKLSETKRETDSVISLAAGTFPTVIQSVSAFLSLTLNNGQLILLLLLI